MPANKRAIGSEGLEQGGPSLGNDITRKDLSVGNAGDALLNKPIMGANNEDAKDADLNEENLDDDELEADDEPVVTDDELDNEDAEIIPDDEDLEDIDDDEEDVDDIDL